MQQTILVMRRDFNCCLPHPHLRFYEEKELRTTGLHGMEPNRWHITAISSFNFMVIAEACDGKECLAMCAYQVWINDEDDGQ